jgi:Protein of unknown function (DUF1559)
MIRLPILIAPRHDPFVKKMTQISSFVAKSPSNSPRRGASRLEYVFVAFLLLLLVSLLSTGLLRARESAREQMCRKRLVALAKAVNEYGETHVGYPGFVNPSQNSQVTSTSWVASILPHLSDRLPPLVTTKEGWEAKDPHRAKISLARLEKSEARTGIAPSLPL